MLIGQTHAEIVAKNKKKWESKVHGKNCRVKKFAFFPVKLNNGQYAWLRFIYAEGEFYRHPILGVVRNVGKVWRAPIHCYTTIDGV